MKNKVVLFDKAIPRILVGINPLDYKNNPVAAINPDLSKLLGIPPHYWKLENGQIVEKSNVEKQAIALKLRSDNQVITLPKKSRLAYYLVFALGLSCGLLLSLYL